MTIGAIPAGWYPDPGGPGSARWWNGAAWSAETRAVPPAGPPAVPTAPPWVATASPAQLVPAGPSAPTGSTTTTFTLPGAAPGTAWHGSPNTVGVWLLALAPLITNVVVFAGVLITTIARVPVASPLLFVLPVLVAEWVFAALDRAALGRRGFDRPALAWMLLLPPLVYLIARGRSVRRAGAKAWPPELAYFLQIVLFGLANVGLASLLNLH